MNEIKNIKIEKYIYEDWSGKYVMNTRKGFQNNY